MMEAKFVKNGSPIVMNWDELNTLINIRPLMACDRVNVLPKRDLTWMNDVWTTYTRCFPPSEVKKSIEEGIVIIHEMSRFTEKLNSVAKELEEEYDSPCDAHIFTCGNPDLQHPFGAHYDKSDNKIIQCEGVTNWKVWEPMDGIKDYDDAANLEVDSDPIIDVDMHPGDVIYVPRDYIHLATTKTRRLSVSFPIRADIHPAIQEREWYKLFT